MKSFCMLVVVSCCLAVVYAKTECEEHRERELKSNTKMKLVPRCTSNGDYESLQCFEGSNFCMCWRPDGSHINAPSNAIKTCECHVHLDNAIAKCKGCGGQHKYPILHSKSFCLKLRPKRVLNGISDPLRVLNAIYLHYLRHHFVS